MFSTFIKTIQELLQCFTGCCLITELHHFWWERNYGFGYIAKIWPYAIINAPELKSSVWGLLPKSPKEIWVFRKGPSSHHAKIQYCCHWSTAASPQSCFSTAATHTTQGPPAKVPDSGQLHGTHRCVRSWSAQWPWSRLPILLCSKVSLSCPYHHWARLSPLLLSARGHGINFNLAELMWRLGICGIRWRHNPWGTNQPHQNHSF